jgi:O-methyltransferase
LYPRLVAGGMLVMDDYGWAGYQDQHELLERFFADRPEELIALPTGQPLVVKLP